MPDDLEWPRRAIVGAIAVISVAKLATFTKGPGVVQRSSREILRQDRGELLECPVSGGVRGRPRDAVRPPAWPSE